MWRGRRSKISYRKRPERRAQRVPISPFDPSYTAASAGPHYRSRPSVRPSVCLACIVHCSLLRVSTTRFSRLPMIPKTQMVGATPLLTTLSISFIISNYKLIVSLSFNFIVSLISFTLFLLTTLSTSRWLLSAADMFADLNHPVHSLSLFRSDQRSQIFAAPPKAILPPKYKRKLH